MSEREGYRPPDKSISKKPSRFGSALAGIGMAFTVGRTDIRKAPPEAPPQKPVPELAVHEEPAPAPAAPEEAAAPETAETRIAREVEKVRDIIASGNPSRIFENGFLVQALYYSKRFWQRLESGVEPVDPAVATLYKEINKLITPELRTVFLEVLAGEAIGRLSPATAESARRVSPLENMRFGHGPGHSDAIDIFTAEGAQVRSMTRGIVVLAESGWRPDDPFSTSSARGGNTVIIFDPDKREFYRYCHFDTVAVKPYDVVEAGDTLGDVGHTGTNASKAGHGSHLHLEINRPESATGGFRPTGVAALERILKTVG